MKAQREKRYSSAHS